MDYENTVKKYIKPSAGLTAAFFILLAITLLLAALGVASIGKGDVEEPAPFSPLYSESGDYVYLDIVGVSDWLYNYDGSIYYAVEDREGYSYIAQIGDSEYDGMGQLFDYWYRESDYVPVPQDHRLVGTAYTLVDNLNENLSEVLGLTQTEFESYFGYMYIDATITPGENTTSMYFVFAMFALIIWMIAAVPYFTVKRNMKRSLKALEESGQMMNASNELEGPTGEQLTKKLLLTRSFIFCKNGGFAASYNDVKWIFKRVQRYNFIPVASYIVVNTKYLSNVNLLQTKVKDKAEIGQTVTDRILSVNPDVMVGYAQENIKAYKELYKAAKAERT